ncbi:hypothetical protein GGR56DRAFT_28401 [Xylariaceae sp. FL0804]|nr:hypothetical protein GGR56DRAFT_28401 [Xylariaceae sp. FL0804]
MPQDSGGEMSSHISTVRPTSSGGQATSGHGSAPGPCGFAEPILWITVILDVAPTSYNNVKILSCEQGVSTRWDRQTPQHEPGYRHPLEPLALCLALTLIALLGRRNPSVPFVSGTSLSSGKNPLWMSSKFCCLYGLYWQDWATGPEYNMTSSPRAALFRPGSTCWTPTRSAWRQPYRGHQCRGRAQQSPSCGSQAAPAEQSSIAGSCSSPRGFRSPTCRSTA